MSENTKTESGAPEPLTGLDAELHDALAECGRIIEAMPHDERKIRVRQFFEDGNLGGISAQDFIVGVMIVAHQRRLFDEAWTPSGASDG